MTGKGGSGGGFRIFPELRKVLGCHMPNFRSLGQSLHIDNFCKNEGGGGRGELFSLKQNSPQDVFRVFSNFLQITFGKLDFKDNRGGPPPDFCKNYFFHLGWTYRKLVRGPIGNRFVDLSETGSWTYRKPVRGPNGNRFVDLTETGSWT